MGSSVNDPNLISIPPSVTRRRVGQTRSLARRGLLDKVKGLAGSVTDATKDAAGKVADGAKDAAGAVADTAGKAADATKDAADKAGDAAKDAAGKVADGAKDAAGKVADAAKDANNVDVNKNFSIPLNFNKEGVKLIDASLDCFPLPQISIKANVDLGAKGIVNMGVLVAGTVVPPNVNTFSLSSAINGNFTGKLSLQASASGDIFDTRELTLFSVGVPGLDIPGIFQLGPTFDIKGRGIVNMKSDIKMDIGINYVANNVAFTFPPSKDVPPPSGDAAPQDSPLTLSASPDVKVDGDITAHIIPTLSFGINVLNGKGVAQIFANLDTSATLGLNLTGATDLTKKKDNGAKGKAAAKKTRAVPITQLHTRAAKGVEGCIGVTSGISANVGAKGALFGVFNEQTKLPLFTKNFKVFNVSSPFLVCFSS